MKAWWDSLQQRQRRALMLAAGVLAAALVYVQVYEPLIEARALERERVASQQALLDWLDAVAPVAEQLRRQQSGQRRDPDQSLLGLADQTARAAGLAGALSRIEPAGQQEVRVWLDQADFVALMGWLQSLSIEHPVEITQLSVDRARRDGAVNVRVTLAANA